MRQYQPIWNRIKTHKHASIVTHPNNVTRVIKAVIKEKHKDKGYKLLLSESALTSNLKITQEDEDKINSSVTIHFSLETTIKEAYIGISNL